MERIIKQQREKLLNRKQLHTIQLYILVEGPFVEEIRTIYIIINSTVKYQFQSVMKAFDTLFKLFHTSHKCYPVVQ